MIYFTIFVEKTRESATNPIAIPKTKKKMKLIQQIILSLLLTLLCLASFGQQTFEKTYFLEGEADAEYSFTPYYVSQNEESDYIVGGYMHLQHIAHTFISKLNSDGELIWGKALSYIVGRDIIQTSDGGFFITGSYFYGDNDWYSYMLIKTNANCDTLWTKRVLSCDFPGNSFFRAYSSKETNDNALLTVGARVDRSFGSTEVFLLKTDFDGNVIWKKTIGASNNSLLAFDFKQTSDNGFVFCGSFSNLANEEHNALLLKIDESGGVLWSKSYSDTLSLVLKKIELTVDNKFVALGYIENQNENQDIFILKTDDLGNVIWSKTIKTPLNAFGWDLLSLPKGDIVFTGLVQDSVELDDDLLFVKLNEFGDTVCTKFYGEDKRDVGYSLCKTNDNGFMIAGNSRENSDDNSLINLLLIKTDSCGNTACAHPTCLDFDNLSLIVDTLSLEMSNFGCYNHAPDCQVNDFLLRDSLICPFSQNINVPVSDNIISAYPNPFYESCQITFEKPTLDDYTISLFNVTGKLVRQINRPNASEFTLHRESLPEGLYLVQVHDKTQIIGQLKIVIQ